jgi:hypothetical protein
MNFDDYKKKFEVFAKIDTPEKLAICEQQYQQYLLRIDDEKYFEPIDEDFDNRKLSAIFNSRQVTETQISFFKTPSFEPDSLLVIKHNGDKFILEYSVFDNTESEISSGNSIPASTTKTTYTANLRTETGTKLFNLLHKTILEARAPRAGRIVLDGVGYYLSCKVDEQFMAVCKTSPSEISKPGKVVEVLELLTHNIELLGTDILQEIETKIDNIDK